MKVYCITTIANMSDTSENEPQIFRKVFIDRKEAEIQAQMVIDDIVKELSDAIPRDELEVNDIVGNRGGITLPNGDTYEVGITEHMLVGKIA